MTLWFAKSQFWLGLILVVAIMVTALASIHTAYQTRQLYSAIQEANEQRDRLSIAWSQLVLERGALSADWRIDAIARQQLAMRAPLGDEVRLMERAP